MVCSFQTDALCCFVFQQTLLGSLEQLAAPLKLATKAYELERQWCAACVLEALSQLHSCDIVLRGLSPAELQVDDKGYVVATSFGNCKVRERC